MEEYEVLDPPSLGSLLRVLEGVERVAVTPAAPLRIHARLQETVELDVELIKRIPQDLTKVEVQGHLVGRDRGVKFTAFHYPAPPSIMRIQFSSCHNDHTDTQCQVEQS